MKLPEPDFSTHHRHIQQFLKPLAKVVLQLRHQSIQDNCLYEAHEGKEKLHRWLTTSSIPTYLQTINIQVRVVLQVRIQSNWDTFLYAVSKTWKH
ncbi:hypothetical protein HanIR_Chr13g0668981 [Helianthus annuus]|nr:hypothetical protein HanIR_Chr13g0668981 [Helianthus annuus]